MIKKKYDVVFSLGFTSVIYTRLGKEGGQIVLPLFHLSSISFHTKNMIQGQTLSREKIVLVVS